jgi:hypothetical protein
VDQELLFLTRSALKAKKIVIMGKCRLHSDCIVADSQQKGRTLSVAKNSVPILCVHCQWTFCCTGCLAGHPETRKGVSMLRVCKHVPFPVANAVETTEPELLPEILQQLPDMPPVVDARDFSCPCKPDFTSNALQCRSRAWGLVQYNR